MFRYLHLKSLGEGWTLINAASSHHHSPDHRGGKVYTTGPKPRYWNSSLYYKWILHLLYVTFVMRHVDLKKKHMVRISSGAQQSQNFKYMTNILDCLELGFSLRTSKNQAFLTPTAITLGYNYLSIVIYICYTSPCVAGTIFDAALATCV